SVEETVSIRGIRRLFAEETGIPFDETPEPDVIYKIGIGSLKGPQKEAVRAWENFGKVLGEVLANAVTLIDGLVVIGGGLSGAYRLFLPKTVEVMNRKFQKPDGGTFPRMEVCTCNLHDHNGMETFLSQEKVMVNVPFTNEPVPYYPQKKIGVGITWLGTSRAVAVGAYAFAMNRI
ncbi:MAG: ROK family protein, partial [Chlorobi bacterium]|nr:ROK family protein [Chlorobiota bacterium]